ncbi:MAG: 30S ribosomal protein S17 [Elusimicrobia bacterium CG08_land_8_20_14_0_20_44_26]|nr:MAG: 30S ribosomal protein S17 [Elusimicrobia bacterium CG08_land_8_20_14_0_20_44_26]
MRKKLIGKVTSDKNDKSRVVQVDRSYRDAAYDKVVMVSKKLHCHDEKNISAKGDTVVIIQSKPYSALKRWAVISVKNKVKK